VRQCKTAAEERDVIAKESAALRQAFKEQDGTYRHRLVGQQSVVAAVARVGRCCPQEADAV
jgi:AP-1 complex subunit gamma-1